MHSLTNEGLARWKPSVAQCKLTGMFRRRRQLAASGATATRHQVASALGQLAHEPAYTLNC